jgi:hypothetical protein
MTSSQCVFRAIACAAASYLAGASLVFAQDDAPPVAAVVEAARFVAFFERIEQGEIDPAPPAYERLGSATRALQDYLAASPDDVEALMLFARLGRFSIGAEPIVIGPGEQPLASETQGAAEIAALEHVLELEPGNAEAHYWLARIHGQTVPKVIDDVLRPGPLNLGQAIANALRAAELGPNEVRYREAAAGYLAQAQRFDEAMNLFADNDSHAIRRILADLASVPLPPEARYLPDESAGAVETFAPGVVDDYLLLRARMYVAPGGRSVFETPLKQRWPEFALYEARRERPDYTAFWTHIMEMRDGAIQPMDPKELARVVRNGERPEGAVWIMAYEISDPTPEARARLGIATGDHFTMLLLMDVSRTPLR